MSKSIRMVIALILILGMTAGCSYPYDNTEATDSSRKSDRVDNTHYEDIYTTEYGRYITGYGMNSEGKLDSEGLYFEYTGGILTLDLYLRATDLEEEGVAVMLFLDGQPQPFRVNGLSLVPKGDVTEDPGDFAYQHMVYPRSNVDSNYSVSFMPVSGTIGETSELCVMYFPSYQSPYVNRAWYQESGTCFYLCRIKMEAEPELLKNVDISLAERVVSWEVTYTDFDDSTWLENTVASNVYFNGRYLNGTVYYNFDDTEPLDFEFKLFGDSNQSYVLVIYVDGEPVLIDGSSPEYQVISGKTTTVHAKLDCSGLDDEAIVFAILMQKSYKGEGAGWEFYPEPSDIKLIHLVKGGKDE